MLLRKGLSEYGSRNFANFRILYNVQSHLSLLNETDMHQEFN